MRLVHGDCLEIMPTLADQSIDLILCDLPYGTTACKWDTVIPFAPLWTEYKRIIKPRGAIVLTASQPFTSALVMSNVKWFRYEWIWRKEPTGALNAKLRPMQGHESALVFSPISPPYNPQGLRACNRFRGEGDISHSDAYGKTGAKAYTQTATGYPTSILPISKDAVKVHPTQKPVALMEYMIRTYSNEGETILDNCMGSGTTGVACVNTGRAFIGIEKDAGFFRIAEERIGASLGLGSLFNASLVGEQ